MHLENWLPIYRTIADDLDLEREPEVRARDRLADLVGPGELDETQFEDATVAIAGAAPSLESDLDGLRDPAVVVAASDAGARLDDEGIEPALVVTDLDGAPDRTVELAGRGVPVAVHAHGDNVPALEEYVPELPAETTVGTTQIEPVGPLLNYGGFTDGDRAAFLADEFGASRLCFPGWDLDDPALGPLKRKKLQWAEHLLHVLEGSRSERFELLDGRRSQLDLQVLEDE
jgi:uncharacterized Rossmann fold enzyme